LDLYVTSSFKTGRLYLTEVWQPASQMEKGVSRLLMIARRESNSILVLANDAPRLIVSTSATEKIATLLIDAIGAMIVLTIKAAYVWPMASDRPSKKRRMLASCMIRTELVMGAGGVSNTGEICDANASRNLSNSDRGVRNTVVAIFPAGAVSW